MSMALRTAERPAGIAKNVFNLTGKRRGTLAFVLLSCQRCLLAIWTYCLSSIRFTSA